MPVVICKRRCPVAAAVADFSTFSSKAAATCTQRLASNVSTSIQFPADTSSQHSTWTEDAQAFPAAQLHSGLAPQAHSAPVAPQEQVDAPLRGAAALQARRLHRPAL